MGNSNSGMFSQKNKGGDCGGPCKSQKANQPPQPTLPPPPTVYNKQQGGQGTKDVYDSKLGNQRFQSQSARHY
jgi:hypothetical protein